MNTKTMSIHSCVIVSNNKVQTGLEMFSEEVSYPEKTRQQLYKHIVVAAASANLSFNAFVNPGVIDLLQFVNDTSLRVKKKISMKKSLPVVSTISKHTTYAADFVRMRMSEFLR